MHYLFGPVNSRRLGRSLGLDLIPTKLCTFDCIYCEVGPKRAITCVRKEYAPLAEMLEEIDRFLADAANADSFDILTLTASGEPTLHAGIGKLIAALKKRLDKPLAVLTNGSLLHDAAVRRDLAAADLVIPSLDAARLESYRRVNRPHPDISLELLIDGICRFSREFSGRLWLEILLVKNVNDQPQDIEALQEAVERIAPDKIQINTVVRPPLEENAQPVPLQTLQDIAGRLGAGAEVIASFKGEGRKDFHPVDPEAIIAMLRRRPCTEDDICAALSYNKDLLVETLRQLKEAGRISLSRHDGIVYWTCGVSC
jgi:wyosine [tRNA(Phe)-imidazoG37] synthetase (radical SAM superfamily)